MPPVPHSQGLLGDSIGCLGKKEREEFSLHMGEHRSKGLVCISSCRAFPGVCGGVCTFVHKHPSAYCSSWHKVLRQPSCCWVWQFPATANGPVKLGLSPPCPPHTHCPSAAPGGAGSKGQSQGERTRAVQKEEGLRADTNCTFSSFIVKHGQRVQGSRCQPRIAAPGQRVGPLWWQ